MKVVNATQARQNIYRLIDETIVSNEPVQITAKKGSVVLLSESDWRDIQETLYLVSIPGMRESIIEGMKTPVSECFEDIGWDIN
jgi:PHD/YefM family antitoxin component YafN of YafNO toxin-antitoxin module